MFSRSTPFDFNQDSLDAAIHFGNPEWPGTACFTLFGETVIPVGSPSLVRQFEFVRAEDVRKARLLILLSRPDAWERWLEVNGAPQLDIHGMMFDQFETIIQAAKTGLGLGLLPSFLIAAELESGELTPAWSTRTRSSHQYHLVYPKEKEEYAPLVAFRAWLERCNASAGP